MPQFTKTPPAPTMSAARQRLASMIAARDEIAAKIESLQAALTRLASAQTADGPIAGELAALDAAEAAAMNEWARSGIGEAPTPDLAKRDSINKRLSDARAKAASAKGAEAGLVAERDRESMKLRGLPHAVDVALAEIMVEEVKPLIADFDEANRAVAAKASRIEVLRDIIGGMARSAGDVEPARPFYALLESFNTRLQKVSGRLLADLDTASRHRLGWFALADQLRSDATAKLSEASA